jgi:hypothetical protein
MCSLYHQLIFCTEILLIRFYYCGVSTWSRVWFACKHSSTLYNSSFLQSGSKYVGRAVSAIRSNHKTSFKISVTASHLIFST